MAQHVSDIGDDPEKALTDWSDAARLKAALRVRSAQRWNERLAAESATFNGLICDLYETASPLQVQLGHGRVLSGTIVEVGQDFVGLSGSRDQFTLLPFASIVSIQLAGTPNRIGTVSDRTSVYGRSFVEALGDMAHDRVPIRFSTRASELSRSGTLVGVGQDLVTVQSETPDETIFVRAEDISELSVR